MPTASQQAALKHLLTVASQLPEDVNPYQFIERRLYAYMVPEVSPVFFITLRMNYGISAVGVLFGLIALGIKYKLGSLWFLKRRDTPFGAIYCPNVMCLLAAFITTYFVCKRHHLV